MRALVGLFEWFGQYSDPSDPSSCTYSANPELADRSTFRGNTVLALCCSVQSKLPPSDQQAGLTVCAIMCDMFGPGWMLQPRGMSEHAPAQLVLTTSILAVVEIEVLLSEYFRALGNAADAAGDDAQQPEASEDIPMGEAAAKVLAVCCRLCSHFVYGMVEETIDLEDQTLPVIEKLHQARRLLMQYVIERQGRVTLPQDAVVVVLLRTLVEEFGSADNETQAVCALLQSNASITIQLPEASEGG
eukprot:gene3175-3703_t